MPIATSEEPLQMNPLHALTTLGTSAWIDGLVPPGELERLFRDDAVTGLTSNPTIFRAAVLDDAHYERRVAALSALGADRVYEALGELFGSDRFARLERRGARPQRPLWASTPTKDPRDSDVEYVAELAGPGVAAFSESMNDLLAGLWTGADRRELS